MDKATAEIHDCTRKALMDRIVELESDKKVLEEKQIQTRENLIKVMKGIERLRDDKEILAQIGKEAQQTVLDLTAENHRLERIIGSLERKKL